MTTSERDGFAMAWEEHRGYLLNVAYRLVGSLSESEDLVQEAFARLLRTEDAIKDLRGWLVVVLTRLCLDHLRSARVRRESTGAPCFPEPLVVGFGAAPDPADVVTMDESVRFALLVVLEQLSPAERVAFVLHDVFDFPFHEVAAMIGRKPVACRQLASRARRRVQAGHVGLTPTVSHDEMRRVAELFIAACAGGELQPLLEVLDPAVVGWADIGGAVTSLNQPSAGREQVAERAMTFFGPATGLHLTLAEVNGETGIIATRDGKPYTVMVIRVQDGLVTSIYAVADQRKLTQVRP